MRIFGYSNNTNIISDSRAARTASNENQNGNENNEEEVVDEYTWLLPNRVDSDAQYLLPDGPGVSARPWNI